MTSEADSGDEVLCWQDKSNKGHDVTSSSGAAPIFEFKGPNNLGNLKFDGSNDILSGSIVGLSGNQEHTMIAVYKKSTTGNQRPITIGSGGTGRESSFLIRDEYIVHDHGARYTHTADNRHKLLNKVDILSATYNGISVSTSNSSLYFNGEKVTTAVSGAAGAGTINLTNEITVGSRFGGVTPFNGHIYELIFYDKKLDDSRRRAIEAYLRAKWQKNLDGLSGALSAHYDAMKIETLSTDDCSKPSSPVTDTSSVSCWRDRSGYANHAEQTNSSDMPTVTGSNPDQGGERSVLFQIQKMSKHCGWCIKWQ